MLGMYGVVEEDRQLLGMGIPLGVRAAMDCCTCGVSGLRTGAWVGGVVWREWLGRVWYRCITCSVGSRSSVVVGGEWCGWWVARVEDG